MTPALRRHALYGTAALAVLVFSALVVAFLAARGYGARSEGITDKDLALMMPDASATQSVEELRNQGFKPRPDVEPWPLTLPLDWGADPFRDNNWQFQLHAWVLINPLIQSYLGDGDVAHLQEALRYVDDWYQYHYVRSQSAKYSWFDMSAGIRAMKIALLLDRIKSGELDVSPDIKNHLLIMALDHATRLQVDKYISRGNHGFFQLVGLRLLCEALFPADECVGAASFSDRMVQKIVDASYTSQGVHKEHSPSYAHRVTDWLNTSAFTRWWPKMVKSISKKAYRIQPWLVFPTGRIANIGDSIGGDRPLAKTKVKRSCLTRDRCFAVKDLTESGYAIVRSIPQPGNEGQSMLFVTGAAWSLSHKHVDDLSFELFEDGRMVFIDTGIYSYTTDKMRAYAVGPAAHNTISLDNRYIGRKTLELGGSELSYLRNMGSYFEVAGQVDRPGFFFQSRTIRYAPGKSLWIKDRLSADEVVPYVSSLHLAPDLEPVISGKGFRVNLSGERVLRASVLEDDCRVEAARGQIDPYLGWYTADYLKMEPTTVVRAICPGQNRTITWSIFFEGTTAKPRASQRG